MAGMPSDRHSFRECRDTLAGFCRRLFCAGTGRSRRPGRTTGPLAIALMAVMVISHAAAAQTVRVDVTPGHEVNSVVPNQALGAGIDRLPKGAADKLLAEPILGKILSAKHRTLCRSLALEPAGHLERSFGQGVFHRQCEPHRVYPPFLWIPAASSRVHSQRWDGKSRLFSSDGWGRKYILEEQPLSDQSIHRRRRFAASSMGDTGFRKPRVYRLHQDLMG
jgi:hypothetical protein